MLKLIVAIFLGFQIMAVTPKSSPNSAVSSVAGTLAFVVVPGRLGRKRYEAKLDEESSDETVGDNFQYGAWGEARDGNSFGKSTPFGFTGRWGGYSDGRLGQVLNWNRWYGPSVGRWGSRDPIGIFGGPNIYKYSFDNPGLLTDPSGLKVFMCCRPVEAQSVFANMIANIFGKKHCFLKTDTNTGGMGPAAGQGEPNSPVFSSTQIRGHDTQIGRSICVELPDADENCVNTYLQIGRPTGAWFPFSNDCNATANGIVKKCKKGSAEPAPCGCSVPRG